MWGWPNWFVLFFFFFLGKWYFSKNKQNFPQNEENSWCIFHQSQFSELLCHSIDLFNYRYHKPYFFEKKKSFPKNATKNSKI